VYENTQLIGWIEKERGKYRTMTVEKPSIESDDFFENLVEAKGMILLISVCSHSSNLATYYRLLSFTISKMSLPQAADSSRPKVPWRPKLEYHRAFHSCASIEFTSKDIVLLSGHGWWALVSESIKITMPGSCNLLQITSHPRGCPKWTYLSLPNIITEFLAAEGFDEAAISS